MKKDICITEDELHFSVVGSSYTKAALAVIISLPGLLIWLATSWASVTGQDVSFLDAVISLIMGGVFLFFGYLVFSFRISKSIDKRSKQINEYTHYLGVSLSKRLNIEDGLELRIRQHERKRISMSGEAADCYVVYLVTRKNSHLLMQSKNLTKVSKIANAVSKFLAIPIKSEAF